MRFPIYSCMDGEADEDIVDSPGEIQEEIVSAKAGRKMASVAIVPDAGHLIVQENPRGLANTIWSTLVADNAPGKSKL